MSRLARKLIATCDVFVDNMRPGVADRLGLSYEALSEINPRIVYCTICGWGTSRPAVRPHRRRPADAGLHRLRGQQRRARRPL